jgi:hypothetical protein
MLLREELYRISRAVDSIVHIAKDENFIRL